LACTANRSFDLQKGVRFAYSQLDHGPSWRCAKETTGDPTRFGSKPQVSAFLSNFRFTPAKQTSTVATAVSVTRRT
jgi:hypothetical protein